MLTWQNGAFSLRLTSVKHLGENLTVGFFFFFFFFFFAFLIYQGSKNSKKKKKKKKKNLRDFIILAR
jgi:preprotein translocase subunit YajC